MPDLNSRETWILELSTPEFRLVLMALGGRLTKPEEISEADALCDKLTALRARRLREIAATAEKLDQVLEAKK